MPPIKESLRPKPYFDSHRTSIVARTLISPWVSESWVLDRLVSLPLLDGCGAGATRGECIELLSPDALPGQVFNARPMKAAPVGSSPGHRTLMLALFDEAKDRLVRKFPTPLPADKRSLKGNKRSDKRRVFPPSASPGVPLAAFRSLGPGEAR